MVTKSLVKKITGGSTALIVLAFLLALIVDNLYAFYRAQDTRNKQLEQQLSLLSQSLDSPLWALDDRTITLIGDAFMAGEGIASLKIIAQHSMQTVYNKQKNVGGDISYGEKPILHNGEVIGSVQIGLDNTFYNQPLASLLIYSFLLAAFIVFSLSMLMRRMIHKHLTEPLEKLEKWSDTLASGDYDATPPEIKLEELHSLVNKFFNMSQKIRDREQSLLASESKFRGLFINTEVSIWNEDVSEVYLALENLRQNGVRNLRRHLEKDPELLQELTGKVRVVEVNDATLKLFGASSQEEMFCQIDKTFSSDSINIFIDELCAIWDGQPSFRGEVNYRTLNGQEINTIISFSIPKTFEGFKSLPVTIIDITDLKRAQTELVRYKDQLQELVDEQTRQLKVAHAELLQQERLATLGKLTATVSHELRNPLGTIQTTLCSIEDYMGEECATYLKRSLELAERSIDRCVSIIEELNNYTRVKELAPVKTEIDNWLSTVIEELSIPKEIICLADLSSGVTAEIDQEKLRQVIVNVTTNAIHALQEKDSSAKKFEIATEATDDVFVIKVSDNGIGMTDEIRKKIFEPLYSTKGFGVGLGMVIVKNIVEQHNGRVLVDSKSGEGTTISLHIPRQHSAGNGLPDKKNNKALPAQ